MLWLVGPAVEPVDVLLSQLARVLFQQVVSFEWPFPMLDCEVHRRRLFSVQALLLMQMQALSR